MSSSFGIEIAASCYQGIKELNVEYAFDDKPQF